MPLLFHFDFIAFIFYVIFHIFFHFPFFIHSSLSPIFSLCFPFIQPLKITHQKLTLKTSRTATTATITPPSPGEVIVCGSCCWCCVRRKSTPSFHPCPSTTSTQPSKPRCHLLCGDGEEKEEEGETEEDDGSLNHLYILFYYYNFQYHSI